MKQTAVLIVCDGLGLSGEVRGNAVLAAATPVLTALNGGRPLSDCAVKLGASGESVGLPPGTMGNSEVGHTNLGAGNINYQSLSRINNAIADGTFFSNRVLAESAESAKTHGRAHLFALISDAGVHSTESHLYAASRLLRDVPEVFVHLFTDGRDMPPESALELCTRVTGNLQPNAKIATVIGRFYAMDRDNRWERVRIAYDALVHGSGHANSDILAAIRESYAAGVSDEFIEPIVAIPSGRVRDGDTVVFVNFRPDRARELTRTFVDPQFAGFERELFPVDFVCMTQYDETMPNVAVAFPPEVPKNTLGEYLASLGKTQLRIAET
ncbi:MAG: 2,3-bisphosphoglycerate-independent phosphoglycerate mutase, partial [Oscillospiraceae bacterium]|nr:2,3-bisphosphoglycerate-independent phosphoglycerate mutase [Oscillospiraceae bacterium]